jgi:hypothetical protein
VIRAFIFEAVREKRSMLHDRETFDKCHRFSGDAITAAIRCRRAARYKLSPSMMNGEFTNMFKKACYQLTVLEDPDDRFISGNETKQAEIMTEYSSDFLKWHKQFFPGEAEWDKEDNELEGFNGKNS